MSSSSTRTLQIIYIHGFNGDHTTFQSFPTDLHSRLSSSLHPSITLKSSLYPTYKSRRPLSSATTNFLKWLSTQPPADIILAGHSMGGLLAAEAATSTNRHGEHHRVVGLLAFDTPFLGMHPHVVISGLASLFPHDDEKRSKTEKEMNDGRKVEIVSEMDVQSAQPDHSPHIVDTDGNSLKEAGLHGSGEDDEWDAYKSFTNNSVKATTQKQSLFQKSMAFMAHHSNDPIVKFVKKHKDHPLGASYTWITEHFAFGKIMFDPQELLSRYKVLEGWDKPWTNYWTITRPPSESERLTPTHTSSYSNPGIDTSVTSIQIGTPRPLEEYTSIGELYVDVNANANENANKHSLTKSRSTSSLVTASNHSLAPPRTPPRSSTPGPSPPKPTHPKLTKPSHFITTPFSSPYLHPNCSSLTVPSSYSKWESVQIAGVKDEVAAHCGIFIRGQNLEYDDFVRRVGERVMSWIS